jgi:acyl-CoA dehydrogenase
MVIGGGIDSKFQTVLSEETNRAAVSFGASGAHVTLCLPYLQAYATEEQKKRWLPGFGSGRNAHNGETHRGRQALPAQRCQDLYHRRGASRQDDRGGPDSAASRRRPPVWPVPPRRRHNAARILGGRKLDKIGLKVSDTAELNFTDVAVPAEDLLGDEHCGFSYLGNNLPRERLGIAVNAYPQAEAAVQFAKRYTQDRTVFNQPVASFQNTKFELAACQAEADARWHGYSPTAA